MCLLTKQKSRALLLVMFFTVIYCAVFAAVRIYPFVDLPNHLAAATIFRFYGDPANGFSDYFSLRLFLRPNSAHFLLCGLNLFPSVEAASRAYYLLYIVVLPLAAFLCIRKMKGNVWCTLLVFLFIFNFNVTYGFTGFTLAIPFVLLFYYFLLGYREKTAPRHFWAVSSLLTVLFFLHVLAALYAALFFLLCRLPDYRSGLRYVWLDIAAVSPLAVLVCVWLFGGDSQRVTESSGYFLDYFSNHYIYTVPARLSLVFIDNFSLYAGYRGFLVGALFSVAAAMPVVSLLATGMVSPGSLRSKECYQASVLTVSSLVLFFLLPQDVPGTVHLLYHRFSVFFFLGLILLGSRLCSAATRPLVFVCVAAVVLHLCLWADYFRDFQRQNACFTSEFLPDPEGGKKLAGMMFDYRFRGRSVYVHFPDYYIIWKQGVASTFLIDSGFGSFGSTGRKVSADVLPVYDQWIGKSGDVDGRYSQMDYLLIRGAVPENAASALERYSLLRSGCGWFLYGR